jgi:hypothetical protein
LSLAISYTSLISAKIKPIARKITTRISYVVIGITPFVRFYQPPCIIKLPKHSITQRPKIFNNFLGRKEAEARNKKTLALLVSCFLFLFFKHIKKYCLPRKII